MPLGAPSRRHSQEFRGFSGGDRDPERDGAARRPIGSVSFCLFETSPLTTQVRSGCTIKLAVAIEAGVGPVGTIGAGPDVIRRLVEANVNMNAGPVHLGARPNIRHETSLMQISATNLQLPISWRAKHPNSKMILNRRHNYDTMWQCIAVDIQPPPGAVVL